MLHKLAIKPLIFIAFVITAFFASILINPFIGLCGYLLSYNLNPTGFWWGQQIPDIFQRYSMFFAIACITGMLFHWSKLRYRRFLDTQEILLIAFICIIWMSTFIGISTPELGHNTMKMTKIFIILFLASHIITNIKYYNIVVWVYIAASLYSGFEIFSSSNLSFSDGRLQSGVGGSDFSEGNFLAAHYLMVSPWIGINFIKGDWKIKLFCAISAAFIVNTLILIQSRGSFLGIAVGIMATLVIGGSKYRKKIIFLLLIGIMGFFYLSDKSFWTRMDTIETKEETMDSSASGRVEAWRAAIEMFSDHPFGVGEGNFKTLIGNYNPEAAGRDTHNTFFRCIAELGMFGITIMLFMIYNAFKILSQIKNSLDINSLIGHEYALHILALQISLIMYLVTTLFLSHTYVEEFYWLLMFPLFLKRCYENEA